MNSAVRGTTSKALPVQRHSLAHSVYIRVRPGMACPECEAPIPHTFAQLCAPPRQFQIQVGGLVGPQGFEPWTDGLEVGQP